MLSRVSTAGGLPDSYQLAVPALAERGLVFGRNTDSDIVLNTDLLPLLISRTHAKLSVVGHALFLQDAGSTNGTYVNEGRLQANVSKKLVNGNTVSFGGPKLIIRDGQHHQNPFVYTVSAVDSVTGQAQPQQDVNTEATQAVEAVAEDVPAAAASRAPTASAIPISEQLVDLTRTSSAEAGPSGVVDLTGSPDIHVGIPSSCLEAAILSCCSSSLESSRISGEATDSHPLLLSRLTVSALWGLSTMQEMRSAGNLLLMACSSRRGITELYSQVQW